MAGKRVLVVIDEHIVQNRLVTSYFNRAISMFDNQNNGTVYILPTFFPTRFSVCNLLLNSQKNYLFFQHKRMK